MTDFRVVAVSRWAGLIAATAGSAGALGQSALPPRPEPILPDVVVQAPVTACFAPGTDPEYIRRVMTFVDLRNRALFGYDYFTATRWSGTTGTPRALTWSFVPDGLSITGSGEPTSPSELFARMDTAFASQGGRVTWMMRFQQVFNRYGQITGNTYTRIRHNNNDWDDGGAWGTAGVAGLRGDVRIGMHPIDGPFNTLAYNYYPSHGDMVLDTDDADNFSSNTNQNRELRNVVAHEHGHGLGLDHTCSSNSNILMEPEVTTGFDGPQQDDIRGVQSLYGDPYEANNTSATARALGTLAQGGPIAIGTVPPPISGQSDTNAALLSIHGDGDADWYSFAVGGASQLTATATPIGSTYDASMQAANGSCPISSSVNGAAVADLVLTVFGTNGTTILATANSSAAGQAETVSGVALPAGGTYFVRVTETGTPTGSQLYKLNLSLVCSSAPVITQQPGGHSVPGGSPASFSVTATNAVSYQWRKDGVPLVNGGHIQGATSSTLQINPAGQADQGVYSVRVSSACATVTSFAVPLIVTCYANCDGSTTQPVLNVDDFVCFINQYVAGDGSANCDGSTTPPVLNILDIICFQGVYQRGCQ